MGAVLHSTPKGPAPGRPVYRHPRQHLHVATPSSSWRSPLTRNVFISLLESTRVTSKSYRPLPARLSSRLTAQRARARKVYEQPERPPKQRSGSNNVTVNSFSRILLRRSSIGCPRRNWKVRGHAYHGGRGEFVPPPPIVAATSCHSIQRPTAAHVNRYEKGNRDLNATRPSQLGSIRSKVS